ncbi:PREDICTED: synaptonemal complex central element protein 2 [Pseudopodoces humilis]|uniref:synaptonemal complex central element protein 2 n=1 Tax=Pseudopodoces humilis TaxID=181119 RepID=UPI0006B7F3FA|nr:PREDICTED: synaptonemal complex central element protein 2 [Pseudopodoces humilis]
MSREEPEGPELEVAAGDNPFPEGPGPDEPPGKDPDWPDSEPGLGPRASVFFASLEAGVGRLQQRAQDLCNRVNDNRKEDQMLLSSLRETLLLKVSELAEQLEERLFHNYGYHNELIQERLRALTEVMESMEEIQAELRNICRTVEEVYRDLCLQPEA